MISQFTRKQSITTILERFGGKNCSLQITNEHYIPIIDPACHIQMISILAPKWSVTQTATEDPPKRPPKNFSLHSHIVTHLGSKFQNLRGQKYW